MASNDPFDPNDRLSLALVPPVQGSKGFIEYSSASVSLPNDVSYEYLSNYIERISHLNPNLVSGNMGSHILNNSIISGPNVEASSLLIDATSLMSDGANFRKTSVNIESYQNLPSSPLSFSSSNMSVLAIEGASSSQMTTYNLNQINHVTRRRGRRQSDMSSLFTDRERELLEYLPQMPKKPRIDAHVNALHQHFSQQPLQKQELSLLQDYNQQLKTLLQQHNLQKLKQKQRLQSIPQYVRAPPTQQQMRNYLQQMAKRSVPAAYPLPSGICSRRLMQFIYHLQQRPSDNSITYWRKFVAEYYALHAKKRWCLSLYNDIGERALGVFSQLAMEAWHCDMCGSKSGKGFEVNFELLPRIYKTYFESGVVDELLFLDLPHEYVLPSGLIVLRYEKAVQETIYEKFRVVREGQLRIIFQNDLKMLAWEFCARCHDEVVPRRLVAPQVNELVQAAEKCQRKGGSSGNAVRALQSTCKTFVAAEGRIMKNLDSLLVNDLGFPKRYIRSLQIAEIINSMKDLMTFSLDNNLGPIESLAKYSQEGTISKTEKKQAGTSTTSEIVASQSGTTSCHQNSQSCTSKSGKQKTSAFKNYTNTNDDLRPLLDPKSSGQSIVQRSPVSCTASSTISEFDDKLQEQMIDKILQKMESNTREQTNFSKSVKIKEEKVEYSNGSPTVDVGSKETGKRIIGNTSTAALKSVPQDGSKMKENSKAATSSLGVVKQEPDVEDIYKDLYLPEAIRDVDRGFFRLGALNDEYNDIGWKGKH